MGRFGGGISLAGYCKAWSGLEQLVLVEAGFLKARFIEVITDKLESFSYRGKLYLIKLEYLKEYTRI